MNTIFRTPRNILLASLFCVVGLPVCALAQSDVHPYMKDGFIVQAGAFLPRLSLAISVDGTLAGEAQEFDFDGALGASSSDEIFAAELIWRFGEKWSFRGQYFSGSRTATKTLEEDVEWGDAVFQQGSFVSAGTSLDITRLVFARDFSVSLHHEFGVGLGLHRMGFDVFLTGNLVVNGESLTAETRAVSAVAPLPNIGGWYAYSPSEKWVFDVRLDWLDATIGEYSGGLLNLAGGANYQLFKHVGVGVKYQRFHLKFDIDKPDWHGSMKLKYEGAYLYVSANWG